MRMIGSKGDIQFIITGAKICHFSKVKASVCVQKNPYTVVSGE